MMIWTTGELSPSALVAASFRSSARRKLLAAVGAACLVCRYL